MLEIVVPPGAGVGSGTGVGVGVGTGVGVGDGPGLTIEAGSAPVNAEETEPAHPEMQSTTANNQPPQSACMKRRIAGFSHGWGRAALHDNCAVLSSG